MPPMVKRILHILVWGFLAYAVITNPDRASDVVKAVWDMVSVGFLNIGRFFANLLM